MSPTVLRRILLTSAALSVLSFGVPAFAEEDSPFKRPIVGVQPEMLAWIQDAKGKLIELALTRATLRELSTERCSVVCCCALTDTRPDMLWVVALWVCAGALACPWVWVLAPVVVP